MADILIRGLDEDTVERLKARAKRHGRSLQSEARRILKDASGLSEEEAVEVMRYWQNRLAGRQFRDSAELIREDRDR